MKTLIILLIAALAANSPAWAQSAQYQQAMTDAITAMRGLSKKSSATEFVVTANRFERIAGAEPGQWLPRYYAGLLYVYGGFSGKDAAEKDRYLDQADRYLKEAEAIDKNDELAVLNAYIAQARMVVDPMSRWEVYGPKFSEGVQKAKAMNPANPRPYLLEGSSLMYTPAQFGGGTDTACPLLRQAAEKFTTFKPATNLHPSWGDDQVEGLLTKCPK
ncbi:MAG: hypothetical protein H7319_13710 [Spirosoma sp.]|nr:hypothetical protein [Spirosoma sp.]